MRKGISILSALVLILSGLHVTVSTHFCGGREVASVVSFSGVLATCGMEGNEASCPLQGQNVKSLCCEDFVSVYATDNNYTPSVTFQNFPLQTDIQFFATPVGYLKNQYSGLTHKNRSYTPPGVLQSTDVDISRICIFLI
jgi:hypothetical protein